VGAETTGFLGGSAVLVAVDLEGATVLAIAF
jgi:hypothetical protein